MTPRARPGCAPRRRGARDGRHDRPPRGRARRRRAHRLRHRRQLDAVPGRRRDPGAEGGGGARRGGRARRHRLRPPRPARTCASTRSPTSTSTASSRSRSRDFRPEIVYTVHPDVNRDHRALFDSVAVATRPVPGQPVRRVLTYAPTSSTEWTPAGLNWFVPELVRRRDGDARPEAGVVRALRDGGAARTRIRAASARSGRPRSSSGRAAAARRPSRSCSCAASSPRPGEEPALPPRQTVVGLGVAPRRSAGRRGGGDSVEIGALDLLASRTPRGCRPP